MSKFTTHTCSEADLTRVGRVGMMLVTAVMLLATLTAFLQGRDALHVLLNPVWATSLPVWVIMYGIGKQQAQKAQESAAA